ncbi:MAG: DUF1761 domain-containing protein [Bacteroidetes bacterium]|nr:MAG: DUF1761 domain-containing protein [Bacteroidota bacterium]
MPLHINIVAVLAAVVINFIIGFLWYAALFAKAWTKEMGYDPNMRPGRKAMMKGMVLMVIGNFLFAWVFAFYLAGWQYIPGANKMNPFAMGINSAISVWIGFFVPVHISRVVWEKHSWKLFFINSGYHLVATIVVALILSYWT